MKHWPIKISLFINYFVFAILLNSVGTVILQVQNTYGVSESSASVLEAFKDLPIAITSFLIASFMARIGYKRAMLIALGFIAAVCLTMPQLPAFWMIKGPKASWRPPKYSATIAAITASEAAILKALKKNGIALGTRTSLVISHRLAPYDRIRSI